MSKCDINYNGISTSRCLKILNLVIIEVENMNLHCFLKISQFSNGKFTNIHYIHRSQISFESYNCLANQVAIATVKMTLKYIS